MGEGTNPFPVRDEVYALLERLGVAPHSVKEVTIKPDEIHLRRFSLDRDGNIQADHLGQVKTYVDVLYWI